MIFNACIWGLYTQSEQGQPAEMDRLVHALFGLTVEEIALVEGKA